MALTIRDLDCSYAQELEGLYVPWQAAQFPHARLLVFNTRLADALGLNSEWHGELGLGLFTGARLPEGARPLAMAYAGHQFGHFSPQLGDGRALLLGELKDVAGNRFDLHLKGSGATPFARGGDGKATLGPMLREYLISEAMHALGIPTTRGLAVLATGELIRRETLLPGAILARVAASHIRVGTFEFFASHQLHEELMRLVRYTINRHYPAATTHERPALALLRAAVAAQVQLIAHWMLVGFVHGVMNTDNMALSGETIDYGPCAFLDVYHADAVFSSIDHYGRYAFGNQPAIARWNLARLAEALLPLIDEDQSKAIDLATVEVTAFDAAYDAAWRRGMAQKLGLTSSTIGTLPDRLLELMQDVKADFTLTFRALIAAAQDQPADLIARLGSNPDFTGWYEDWRQQLMIDPATRAARIRLMQAANPIYIPRNAHVEAALNAAVDGDLAPFHRLLAVLQNPFELQDGAEGFAGPGSDSAPYVTYCGT